MKIFLIKIVLLAVIVVAFDFVLGNILEYAYFRQQKGRLYRTTNTLENVNAECLIFGCSRAVQHYDPEIIEKETGLTTYNVGSDGQSIVYHELILENILSRYTPKMIVLELFEVKDFAVSDIAGQANERLSYLFPYISKFPNIKKALWERTKYEKYKLMSKTYRYNSMILRIIEGNMGFFDYDNAGNGYKPNDRKLSLPLRTANSELVLDVKRKKYFEKFVDICRKNDIPLYVVISPAYINCEDCNSITRELCNQVNIELHDFSADEYFLSDISYFGDVNHLNKKGSKIYSEFIGSELLDFYNYFQPDKSPIASE